MKIELDLYFDEDFSRVITLGADVEKETPFLIIRNALIGLLDLQVIKAGKLAVVTKLDGHMIDRHFIKAVEVTKSEINCQDVFVFIQTGIL